MFGRKKNNAQKHDQTVENELNIQTIPQDFYGGKNPDIFSKKQHTKDIPSASIKEKKSSAEKKQTSDVSQQAIPVPSAQISFDQSGSGASMQSSSQPMIQNGIVASKKPKKTWVKVVVIIGLVILLVGIATAYVLYSSRDLVSEQPIPAVQEENEPEPPEPEPTIEQEDPVIEEPQTPVTTTVPTTTEPNVAEDPTESDETIVFPIHVLPKAPDTDIDGLTNAEEIVFGLDASSWDFDGDGYHDGLEVENLYSPLHVSPRKLIDSGVVAEYIHPLFQYRLYYPITWNVDAVDVEQKRVLISGTTGEFVTVYAFTRENESFLEWFQDHAPGQSFSNLQRFENRFGISGYKRTDGLVTYFTTNERVFVLVYTAENIDVMQYPTIVEMMRQSFRPQKTFTQIPEQVLLPSAPGSQTSTENQTTTEDTQVSSTISDQ